MTIKLKVPSIACEVCGETITKAIKAEVPEAQVTVDVGNKTVTVDASTSEETIKNLITSAGHTV